MGGTFFTKASSLWLLHVGRIEERLPLYGPHCRKRCRLPDPSRPSPSRRRCRREGCHPAQQKFSTFRGRRLLHGQAGTHRGRCRYTNATAGGILLRDCSIGRGTVSPHAVPCIVRWIAKQPCYADGTGRG